MESRNGDVQWKIEGFGRDVSQRERTSVARRWYKEGTEQNLNRIA
jgi:hypothetical protein